MKILLVLPRPLFPPDAGGKIRTLRIFEQLAKRVEIHAVSLLAANEEGAVAPMQQLFATYTPVRWQETAKFSPAFYLEFLGSRFGTLPYFLAKYARPELRAAVAQLWSQQKFDLLLCDFLQTAVALQDLPIRPRVIFEHNVEYVIRKRHWEKETHPVKKWLLNAEWRKARDAEAQVCRTFDHVIAVSEDDQYLFEKDFNVRNVTALPTGVDVDFFSPTSANGTQRKPGNLVFVGSMDWYPNEEGADWFLKEVYPLIRSRAANASVTLVGRNPSERLRALAASDPSVEITGTVPDVRPYLARAEAVIVPLRIGGGTRIKIFEAMAMERALISTTLGAEGLPVASGEDCILADEPAQFAHAVVTVLTDSEQRNRLARAARAKVVSRYTWDKVAGEMHGILQRATTSSPALRAH